MALSTTLSLFKERLQQFSAEATNLQAICDSTTSMSPSKRNVDARIIQFCTSDQAQAPTPPPTSLRPILPTEVLDIVFSMLSKEQLKPLLYANSFISALATQRLYHDVVLARPAVIVAFLRTVLASDRLPLLVRSLDIDATKSETVTIGSTISPFSIGDGGAENGAESSAEAEPLRFASHPSARPTRTIVQRSKAMPTRGFYALLARGLRRMRGLVSLTLELPKPHTPLWIFDGCAFRLRQLTTSMYCRRPLARFLETQGALAELTLRGYQTDALMFLPFMDPGLAQASAQDGGPPVGEDVFRLAPGSLPNLRAFNAVHADADLVRAVVQDRPVEVVSIPLFPERSIATLDALCASSAPLRRLSVISFDPTAPGFLFEALARRFVDLEALHLVLLMAEYDQALLERSAVVLSNFKCLKYITFMAAPSRSTPSANPQPPHTNPPPPTVPGNPPAAAADPAAPSNPDPTPESDADADADANSEADIAAQWHRACPTLRTIILPKGRVWFQSAVAPSSSPAGAGAETEAGADGGGGSREVDVGEGSGSGSGDGVEMAVGDVQAPAQQQPQVVWSAL
ncbi:hypothetical protein BJ912DRAFT_954544 [Pholiota molesta]|nr:hypothetical protein BJ912DRAFT_954544 [Pholiota molesta]